MTIKHWSSCIHYGIGDEITDQCDCGGFTPDVYKRRILMRAQDWSWQERTWLESELKIAENAQR